MGAKKTTKKKVKVKILRSKPWEGKEAKFETYEVPLDGTMSVLNVLTYIAENLDPTLGFYSSCRIGKCMGCQVVVNGKVKLACTTPVAMDMVLEPLRRFKVIKDLVVERKGKEEQ
jgi:succinate dehydrogenase/fumarate reductase iron-sulfur protein